MDRRIDSRQAAAEWDAITDQAVRDHTRFIVERDGKPAVVIMSLAEYLNTAPPPQWLKEAWDRSRALGLDKMTMDEIDLEIATARREVVVRAPTGK